MNKKLKISEIVTDAGTQVRAGLSEATVVDYAQALTGGAKFPPVVAFYDGTRHIAADGFHRIQATIRTGATEIECDVREGSKTDALKFALGSNADHGLRRTNADKRHAVAIALKEFPTLSDRALAEMCIVSDHFVGDMRRKSSANDSQLSSPKRVGRDGKKRRVRRSLKHRLASIIASESEENSAVRPQYPPPPSQVVDETGLPIPTQLIPLWQRAEEVQEMLTTLTRVKGALRDAQENKDKLFAEVNFSSVLSQLDQAWTDIKTAKPYAVCPACQGQVPDQCTLCRGRGLVSQHRWNTCVTREDKELRFKVRQSVAGQGE